MGKNKINMSENEHLMIQIEAKRSQNTQTPAGTARAEDPLGEALLFTKFAEAVPAESEVF